jgi:hypothetical protein
MIDKTIVKITCARAAHEANRSYCMALGDNSQPLWDDAPTWQRMSMENGVEGALAGNTPEESHQSWMKEKEAAGWKYGPKKDPDKKEHPCMVVYAELSEAQRKKDELFLSVVRAMAKALEA